MKSTEIKEGAVYRMHHSSGWTNVRVMEITKHEPTRRDLFNPGRTITRYHCINLSTNREIVVKSAVKFLREVTL